MKTCRKRRSLQFYYYCTTWDTAGLNFTIGFRARAPFGHCRILQATLELCRQREAARTGLSFLAKRLTCEDWLLREHRYWFPKGSSGPRGEGTPGRWLSFEQAKAVHQKARERHFKRPNLAKFLFGVIGTPAAKGPAN